MSEWRILSIYNQKWTIVRIHVPFLLTLIPPRPVNHVLKSEPRSVRCVHRCLFHRLGNVSCAYRSSGLSVCASRRISVFWEFCQLFPARRWGGSGWLFTAGQKPPPATERRSWEDGQESFTLLHWSAMASLSVCQASPIRILICARNRCDVWLVRPQDVSENSEVGMEELNFLGELQPLNIYSWIFWM